MSVQPDLETPEGRLWLVSARAAQLALVLKVMELWHDPLPDDALDTFATLDAACAEIARLVRKYDWANEEGQ